MRDKYQNSLKEDFESSLINIEKTHADAEKKVIGEQDEFINK